MFHVSTAARAVLLTCLFVFLGSGPGNAYAKGLDLKLGTAPDPATNTGYVGPIAYERSGANSFLPDISLIGTMTMAAFNNDPGPSGHNPERTGFNLQEIELSLQADIDSYARADIFFAFSEMGVELEEGFLTSQSLPGGLQIRAGKLKMPFGRFNQRHLETWSFVNDPLVSNRLLGAEGYNEFAIVPSWTPKLPFFLKFEGGFAQGDNAGNFDGTRKQDFSYLGRISTSFDLSPEVTVLMGASGAFGFNDTGLGHSTHLFGGDLFLKWMPETFKGLSWTTEYMYRNKEVIGTTETDGGFYTELVGQWSKRWQAGARFDLYGVPEVAERRYRLSPMIKFMPSEFLSFRAQYDYEHPDVGTVVHAGYLQMIFAMGPHGAHAF